MESTHKYPERYTMAQYLIHAMPKRMWYVEEYLIPSMLEQGIKREQITVYNDEKGEGNLRACMKAFASNRGVSGGTWHIQDDVCICKDFKTLTEALDFGVVCGFSSEMYDGPGRIGAVKFSDAWFSFPCIRIPNDYAAACSEWVLRYIIGNPVYEPYWRNGANDDWAFRAYMKEFHKDECAINLAPNLVDHVDYLLGGGTGKKKRSTPCRAQYFKDFDVVERLEGKINVTI